MSKDYVGIESKICPACAKRHDTGLLMDRRLRNTLERHTVTGWELCPEHKAQIAGGYIILTEIDPEKSTQAGMASQPNNMDPSSVWRTGTIMALKKEAFEQVFDIPAPPGGLVFVEPGVTQALMRMAHPDDVAQQVDEHKEDNN